MILSPPLKITDPTPLQRDFELFVKSQYCGQESWKPVSAIFEQIELLRYKLDFAQYSLSISSDAKANDQMQSVIMAYTKYAFFLDKRFQFETHESGRVDTRFAWSDSFERKRKISHNSIKYELSCLIYNLAVSYIISGMQNYVNNAMVESVKRFNLAIGCIQELRKLLTVLIPEIIAVNVDFSSDNIDLLENIALGMGNAAFYEFNVPNPSFKDNDIACLAGEAGTFLQFAFQILARLLQDSKSGFPQDYLEKVKIFLQCHMALYIGKAALKMYKYYEVLLKDERKESHMGFCLGYLSKGRTILSNVLNNKNTFPLLPKQCQDNLTAMNNEFNQLYSVCDEKNKQIYKAPIVSGEALPPMTLKEEWKMLKGKFNPLINEQIEEKGAFSGFLDTEQLMLATSCRAIAQDRKQTIDLAFRSLVDRKNGEYNNASVLYFINLFMNQAPSSQEVPKALKDKISLFLNKGGQDKLKMMATSLKETSSNCSVLLKSIKEKLDTEAAEDTKMKNQYKEQWTRNPSSTLNVENVQSYERFAGAAKQASESDEETLVKLDSAQAFIDFAYLSEADIIKKLPTNQNQELIKVAGGDLDNLVNLDRLLNQQIEQIRIQIGKIYGFIDAFNFTAAVLDAVSQSVPKDQVVPQVLEAINKEIQVFNGQTDACVKMIGDITALAVSIDQIRTQKTTNTQSINEIDQLGKGMETITNIFTDIEEGLGFYQKLFNQIIDLDQNVSDYVMARQYELTNLVQALNYEMSRSQIRISNFGQVPLVPPPPPVENQPFYTNNQFPQGQAQPFNNQPFGQNIFPSNFNNYPSYPAPPPQNSNQGYGYNQPPPNNYNYPNQPAPPQNYNYPPNYK